MNTQRIAVLGTFGAMFALVACNAILGMEEAELIAQAVGGSGQGGSGGTGTHCNSPAECDDDNVCTTDTCDDNQCANTPLADGTAAPAEAQTVGDCKEVRCSGGQTINVTDDADTPDDQIECTRDECSGGVPAHPAYSSGTPCTQSEGTVCDGDGHCVECVDNTQCNDPDECGGGGEPFKCGCPVATCFSLGLTCGWSWDAVCQVNVDCNDQIQNGDESDEDCGGDVAGCTIRCELGDSCTKSSDCVQPIQCIDDYCGGPQGGGGAGGGGTGGGGGAGGGSGGMGGAGGS